MKLSIGKRWRWTAAGVAGLIVVFAAGLWVGQRFPDVVPVLAPPSQRGQVDQRLIVQASRTIQNNYYNADLDAAQLSDASVSGMVNSLNDPFSRYLTAQQYRSLQDAAAGRNRAAIGISLVYQNGYPVVAGVLANSPALGGGVETDDVITQVNGHHTDALSPDQTMALLRGPAGSQVRLQLLRGSTQLQVTLARENFTSPTVESYPLPQHILYLRVFQFGDSTQKEFDQLLRAGMGGARGAVLDLRDNGGGLVSAAVAMVSRFVASGEVFEQRGRGGQAQRISVDGYHPAATVPLVVLVNQSSASSSEIVAGSLQAHDRADLVGTGTFGKGSIQVDYVLRDGSALRLTVQRWYLPNGHSVNGTGLTPNRSAELPQRNAMFDVVQPARGFARDTQLELALQILNRS